jgi:PAS domain S-box-containing protein
MKPPKQPRETPVRRAAKKSSKASAKSASADKIKDIQRLVHLLEVSQIELEHQNQELRITEQELELSRNKYVNFFDFSPIPFFALDGNGTITEVNLIAGRILGVDRNKLVGKRLVTFVLGEDKMTFSDFFGAIFTSSAKQSCTVRVTTKDKRVTRFYFDGIKMDDALESTQRCQIAMNEARP